MRLDERGKQCPLPVIEAKKALESCESGELLEVVVDNEIAVQNLKKLAAGKGLQASCEKISDSEFTVTIEAGDQSSSAGFREASDSQESAASDCRDEMTGTPASGKRGSVVVLSSNEMGQGDPVLGRLLMKGFVYALTQQDVLPESVLLYNSGAYLSCEGSDNLEDLKALESQGVEILTCGTCLNHFGIAEKLGVGTVTNMYEIAERMTKAALLVRP